MKKASSKKYEIDMCNGSLLGKILLFYLPLMLSANLQLLFNAADIAVVGKFAGKDALAAVGATSSLTNLMVNLFMGLSVGANVLVARYYGAGQEHELREMVQTSIVTSLFSGTILIFIGYFLSYPALAMMETPDEVLHLAVTYMRIYFAGMPFMMAYNFGAAVLRAVGDTRRPLYYLFISGVLNVILNITFVVGLKMDVAGVALATVISQALSAFLVLRCLVVNDTVYKLELKGLHISTDKMIKMFKIGLPAGLQGTFFSISNVIIQSSVNSFGSIAMAGNTASSNVEGFVYISMNSFYQVAISFCGQNYGAKKYKRVGKTLFICQILVITTGLIMGNLSYLFGDKLLKIYTDDPEIISYGLRRMALICVPYCLCGMMDVMVGALRGIGYSILPMLVTLSGACISRIIWIYTIFQKYHTLECLYISYPLSWALTFLTHLLCFVIIYRKLLRKDS